MEDLLQDSTAQYYKRMPRRLARNAQPMATLMIVALLASACTGSSLVPGTDDDTDTGTDSDMGADTEPDTSPLGPCGRDAPESCRVEDGVCLMDVPEGWEGVAQAVLTPEEVGNGYATNEQEVWPVGAGGVLPCSDGIHYAFIRGNSVSVLPPGQFPQPVSIGESASGEPSQVLVIIRRMDTGEFTGLVEWNGEIPFTPECEYWWIGSAEADACLVEAVDLLRPLLPLCPESNADLPAEAGCPCRFNLLSDDVAPQCVDTDGDGIWETPPQAR